MKKFFCMVLISIFALSCVSFAFADVESLGSSVKKWQAISDQEIDELARINNVDSGELKDAIKQGPDEDGRFSPFSNLKTLDNGVTQEQLEELNKQKLSSTGVPLIKSKDGDAYKASRRGQITRENQDTTAYNWTGNKTANGNWPKLGIVAVHRKKDIGGSGNKPVMPFGTYVYLDRTVWLPDGVEYVSEFRVDDTGRGPNKSDYWLDIYYHHDTASAINYGNIVLTYNQMI